MNTLCQNAGALIAKRAWAIFDAERRKMGYVHGEDFAYMLNIHDEAQLECLPENAQILGKVLVDSMEAAGKYYNLNIDITGEYKIGANWSETH